MLGKRLVVSANLRWRAETAEGAEVESVAEQSQSLALCLLKAPKSAHQRHCGVRAGPGARAARTHPSSSFFFFFFLLLLA